jgi:hypothetical protein
MRLERAEGTSLQSGSTKWYDQVPYPLYWIRDRKQAC